MRFGIVRKSSTHETTKMWVSLSTLTALFIFLRTKRLYTSDILTYNGRAEFIPIER